MKAKLGLDRGIDGEDDCSSSTPLMFPAQKNISLRKTRLALDTALAVSDVEDPASPGGSWETIVRVRHRRMLARLTSTGLSLTPLKGRWYNICRQSAIEVPFMETLSATVLEKLPLVTRVVRWLRSRKGGSALAVHCFQSSRSSPAQWRYRRLVLVSEDPSIARGWAAEINSLVRGVSAGRPGRVLAVINPQGGRRKAARVWSSTAEPILNLAGVQCVTMHTEYADHAHELVANMSLEELEGYDGILAVGGDGLFQEVMNGVLALRRGGGGRAALAENMRLAQIPSGSTDAVAWSLNGTRSVETAVLHVALGDGSSLDVMRVDSGDGRTQHSVCYAAYGYMGDLLRRSERLRWLGPCRYALAGAITFLRGNSYAAQITYIPALTPEARRDVVCTVGCELCAAGVVVAHQQNDFAKPASHAFAGQATKEMQGEFRSLMIIVTPCRSDLSPFGLSPGSHLADGRIRLALVRRCSHLQYLRFLASIPRTGIQPGRFDFVDVLDATAVRVTPLGPQSSWNVDGELLRNNFVETSIHRSLLRTFSRGVPT